MQRERSSFRDNSGFVFYAGDSVYRAVSSNFRNEFDALNTSGLFDSLISSAQLIKHSEILPPDWANLLVDPAGIYKVLKAEKVPFISYPYEWCFQQLKDAALLTLDIQLKALDHGMTLKDASAYNVQFVDGKPVFIDSLSFEPYKEGETWVAYRQFCKHFLAPLSLIAKVSPELRKLSQVYIDGIPLSLTSGLLPWKTRFSPFYQLHIHYHSKLELKYAADTKVSARQQKLHLSKNRLVAIIQHLKSGITSLALPANKTEWSDYYSECTYTDAALEHKKTLVESWAQSLQPQMTFDLGCNTGVFSEAVRAHSGQVVSSDLDHLAIERLYLKIKKSDTRNILPLVIDLSEPSAAIGWANEERRSFADRAKADLVLALALIHHLSIGNNLPFDKVAEYFSAIGQSLIIEFVPKDDIQSQRLLVTRKDVFDWYDQQTFETIFGRYYNIAKKEKINGTDRVLYLMSRK
jgi:hypothetical protein